MLSSSYIGKWIDRIGPRPILIGSLIYVALVTIPQAYVTSALELGILRFLTGLGLAGLLPSLNTYISTHAPKTVSGQVFSYTRRLSSWVISSALWAVRSSWGNSALPPSSG